MKKVQLFSYFFVIVNISAFCFHVFAEVHEERGLSCYNIIAHLHKTHTKTDDDDELNVKQIDR